MLKKIRSNRGEVIIEAALYMPMVIVVLFMFVFISLFKLQTAFVQYEEDLVCDQISKARSFVGYEQLAGAKTSSMNGNVDIPEASIVSSIYQLRQRKDAFFRNSNISNLEYKNNLDQMTDRYSIFKNHYAYNSVNSSNTYNNRTIIYQTYINLVPKMFGDILPNIFRMNLTTVGYGTNPTELIRKTDITADSHLWEQRNIGMTNIRYGLFNLKNIYSSP